MMIVMEMVMVMIMIMIMMIIVLVSKTLPHKKVCKLGCKLGSFLTSSLCKGTKGFSLSQSPFINMSLSLSQWQNGARTARSWLYIRTENYELNRH